MDKTPSAVDTTPSSLPAEPTERTTLPADPAPPVRRDAGLRRQHAILLGVGWPLAWMIAVAVEPPSSAHVPLILEVFSLGMMLAMGMLIITAATRRSAALGWASVTGAALLFSAIACPVSGHHPGVGPWWFAQMAVIGGMLAVTGWVAADRGRSAANTDA